MKRFLLPLLLLSAVPFKAPASEYELLKNFPAGRLAALSAGDRPDANGFTGGNRSEKRWMEAGMQRGGCRAVVAAVVAGNLAAADDAWRAIDTAFAHQLPDGGFESNPRGKGDIGPADPHTARVQAAFFFMQELGRAVLVIRESPHEAHFHARIAALEPKVRRGCAFIQAGYDTIIENSSKAVNRLFIAAKAFGLCGLVLHDDQLVATAHQLVALALTLRDEGGVFIEKGGRDSSYNAGSILFGEQLAAHLALPEFAAALPAVVAWQLTMIRESGEVDVSANTRTGVGTETYLGQSKGVNYNEVVFALTHYGLERGDAKALAAADKVLAWSQAKGK